MRRMVLLLLLACGCRDDAPPSDLRAMQTTVAAAAASEGRPVGMLVTQRKGAVAQDTAWFLMAGPLVSTAGWTSWQVSYETNLTFSDSVAVAAQADSVFQHVFPQLAQRSDTTAFMEAHVRSGEHSGYRFLYHRLPDGSWAPVR